MWRGWVLTFLVEGNWSSSSQVVTIQFITVVGRCAKQKGCSAAAVQQRFSRFAKLSQAALPGIWVFQRWKMSTLQVLGQVALKSELFLALLFKDQREPLPTGHKSLGRYGQYYGVVNIAVWSTIHFLGINSELCCPKRTQVWSMVRLTLRALWTFPNSAPAQPKRSRCPGGNGRVSERSREASTWIDLGLGNDK